mgnify:CR=1 FL=1
MILKLCKVLNFSFIFAVDRLMKLEMEIKAAAFESLLRIRLRRLKTYAPL